MWPYVCRLNSTVECIPYHLQLSPQNALQLIQQYPATKPHMTSVVIYTYFCGVELLILFFRLMADYAASYIAGLFSWQMHICVCDDSLILLPSCMISLLTVPTTSPLVIW